MASQKLTFTSIARILDKRDRRKLFALSVARIMANSLDIAGLAGIALLATSFGALASGSARQSPISLPLIGEVIITEVEAVAIAMVVALMFVAKSFFSIWLNLKTSLTVAGFEADFAERLTRNYFSNEPTFEGSLSETVSRFQNSILISTQAIGGFMNGRMTAIAEASLLALLVVIFVFVNPIATVAILIYLAGVILIMNRLVNFRLRRNSTRMVEGSEKALSTSRELFGVRREVQTAGSTELWLGSIISGKRQVATSVGLNYTLNSLPRYVIETSLILGIFAFLAGVVVFSDLGSQSVTIGVFMAGGLRLVASILPLQAAVQQMISASSQAQTAFDNLVAIGRKSDHGTPGVQIAFDGPAGLVFENASFTFPGNDSPTLDSVSFAVPANSKTAIVGPSGAGKTTTFELATGFRLPTKGSVLIEGTNPRQVLELSPGVIGIVPQRPHLVTGSLAENVSLVEKASTDMEKVRLSLEMAGLGEFTDPNRFGLDGKITPDSGELSGGEIQRLGLARALYRNPKILFLDEATSALDAETESRVNKTLDELRGQMTIVLIAHRLSTVMNADNIIYLNKGKVVAQGTFAELKKSVPDFAKAVELMDLGE
jgi:ABC-type multidrug transport system fused ATPase/permease subunit